MRYNVSEKKYEMFYEFDDKRNLDSLAISHDDKDLFIATQRGEVLQLSMKKGEIIVKSNMYDSKLNGNQNLRSELAITPWSTDLIYSVFKTQKKHENFLHRISLEKENLNPSEWPYNNSLYEKGDFMCIVISPDGKSIYLAGQGYLYQVSVEDGKIIKSRTLPMDSGGGPMMIQLMQVTPDKKYLVTACNTKPQTTGLDHDFPKGPPSGADLLLWSIENLELIFEYGKVNLGMGYLGMA